MAAVFDDFFATVPPVQQNFVQELHATLTESGCTASIKEAKSGYVVSYRWNGKSILNWVFRKAGLFARIYGDHAAQYEALIAALPEDMQHKMAAARDCKRLTGTGECSPTCVAGNVYTLAGTTHQKCRNDSMYFLLAPGSAAHIRALACAELAARQP